MLIVQPFLVIQGYFPAGKNLHLEIGVTDNDKVSSKLMYERLKED